MSEELPSEPGTPAVSKGVTIIHVPQSKTLISTSPSSGVPDTPSRPRTEAEQKLYVLRLAGSK